MQSFLKQLKHDWPVHFILVLTNWLPDNVFILKLRGSLIKPFLGKCGKNLKVGRGVTFNCPANIQVGNDVYIAKGCWFLATYGLTIEDEVMFGPYVIVVTANHSCQNGSYRFGQSIDKAPVCIGRGSWIAAHCTILPGSIIKKSSLIGANSVFRGTTEVGGIYAGIPAKLIKKLKT